MLPRKKKDTCGLCNRCKWYAAEEQCTYGISSVALTLNSDTLSVMTQWEHAAQTRTAAGMWMCWETDAEWSWRRSIVRSMPLYTAVSHPDRECGFWATKALRGEKKYRKMSRWKIRVCTKTKTHLTHLSFQNLVLSQTDMGLIIAKRKRVQTEAGSQSCCSCCMSCMLD